MSVLEMCSPYKDVRLKIACYRLGQRANESRKRGKTGERGLPRFPAYPLPLVLAIFLLVRVDYSLFPRNRLVLHLLSHYLTARCYEVR